MEIPQGFERFFPKGWVLRLKKTLYGTKQAARAFWIKLLKVMKDIKFKRSKADPCLYFKWSAKYGLILIILWVDDLLICGCKQACMEVKEAIMQHFKIDDVGEMKEYVGCKVECKNGTIKLTQPVLLQSFIDEFDLPKE